MEGLPAVGQLPGSAQDSGVEEGCDLDPDSNESSSTISTRGGRGNGVGFIRHNSSDRDGGATAGEESNLSFGDPPSQPQPLGKLN